MRHKRGICKLLVFVMIFGLLAGFGGVRPVSANPAITLVQSEIFSRSGMTQTHALGLNVPSGTEIANISVWSPQGIQINITNSGSFGIGMTPPSMIHLSVTVSNEVTVGQHMGQFSIHPATGGVVVLDFWITITDDSPHHTPTPDANNANIVMDSPIQYVSLAPGVSTLVNVALRNTNQHTARNVTITTTPSHNFVIEVVDTESFILPNRASRTIQLRITPHYTMDTGNHTIPFSLSFENNLRQTITTSYSILVRVQRPTQDEPRVIMTDFAIAPQNINAGDGFDVMVTLRNTSNAAAHNTQLTVDGFAAGGITIRNTPVNFIGTIEPGEIRAVTFSFNAGTDMDTGSYPIRFNLRHDGTENRVVESSITHHVTIYGDDEDDDDEYRARLNIVSISSPAGIFEPGQEVRIEVLIENQGEAEASNIRIAASPEAGVVPRLQGIQTMRSLDVGEMQHFTFAFAATSAATSRFYNIGFEVTYNTGYERETNSFTQFTGFLVENDDEDEDEDEAVRSTPRLIISDYTVSSEGVVLPMVMANSDFDLYLTLQNTHGSRTISNIRVTMHVRGTDTQRGDVFTPVDASNAFHIEEILPRETVDHHIRLNVIPVADPRNHTITFVFEYEDEDGNSITAEQEIGINVRQSSRLDMGNIALADTAFMGQPIFVNFNVHNTGRSTLYNLRVHVESEGIDAGNAEQIFGNFTSGSWDFFWGQLHPFMPGPTTVSIIATFDNELGETQTIVQEFDVNVIDMNFGEGGGTFFPPGGGTFTGRDPWDDSWGEEDGGFFAGFAGSLWMWVAIGVAAVLGVAVVAVIVVKKRRKSIFDFDDDNVI